MQRLSEVITQRVEDINQLRCYREGRSCAAATAEQGSSLSAYRVHQPTELLRDTRRREKARIQCEKETVETMFQFRAATREERKNFEKISTDIMCKLKPNFSYSGVLGNGTFNDISELYKQFFESQGALEKCNEVTQIAQNNLYSSFPYLCMLAKQLIAISRDHFLDQVQQFSAMFAPEGYNFLTPQSVQGQGGATSIASVSERFGKGRPLTNILASANNQNNKLSIHSMHSETIQEEQSGQIVQQAPPKQLPAAQNSQTAKQSLMKRLYAYSGSASEQQQQQQYHYQQQQHQQGGKKGSGNSYFRHVRDVIEDVEFEVVRRSEHFIQVALRQLLARNVPVKQSIDAYRCEYQNRVSAPNKKDGQLSQVEPKRQVAKSQFINASSGNYLLPPQNKKTVKSVHSYRDLIQGGTNSNVTQQQSEIQAIARPQRYSANIALKKINLNVPGDQQLQPLKRDSCLFSSLAASKDAALTSEDPSVKRDTVSATLHQKCLSLDEKLDVLHPKNAVQIYSSRRKYQLLESVLSSLPPSFAKNVQKKVTTHNSQETVIIGQSRAASGLIQEEEQEEAKASAQANQNQQPLSNIRQPSTSSNGCLQHLTQLHKKGINDVLKERVLLARAQNKQRLATLFDSWDGRISGFPRQRQLLSTSAMNSSQQQLQIQPQKIQDKGGAATSSIDVHNTSSIEVDKSLNTSLIPHQKRGGPPPLLKPLYVSRREQISPYLVSATTENSSSSAIIQKNIGPLKHLTTAILQAENSANLRNNILPDNRKPKSIFPMLNLSSVKHRENSFSASLYKYSLFTMNESQINCDNLIH